MSRDHPPYDPDPEISVRVTAHAIERFRQRHAEQEKHSDAVRAIVHLVLDAIRHGRFAKRKPAWAVFVEYRGRDDRRYAWDATETVVFALTSPRLESYREDERDMIAARRKRWLVVTVLPRDERPDNEARHLAREHHANRMRRRKDGSWQDKPKRRRPR